MSFKENLENQRQRFIKVFDDTTRFYADHLQEANTSLRENTIVYSEDIVIPERHLLQKHTTCSLDNVTVTKNRTFEAARLLSKEFPTKAIAVLNFASATNPGGGVLKGSSAQEECLCRASNLYESLISPTALDNFYIPNKTLANPIHTDRIIYSPRVTVFKTDDKEYKLLPKEDWYEVGVITCAAPNLREKPCNQFNQDCGDRVVLSDKELYDIHVSRAKHIFEVAIHHNIKVLVLGAFGCGAFKNDPAIVAKAYYDVLKEYYGVEFDRVEFAVYCLPQDDTNYKIFKDTFGGK